MRFWKTLDAVLDRLFSVAGAFFFAQAPEFFQQYLQRLGGHVAELQKQIDLLRYLSFRSGKSLHDYISKFTSHADPDVAGQGQFMQNLLTRHDELFHSWKQISDASVLSRPFKCLWFGDSEIISATFSSYKPGIAFTSEGVAYVVVGAFIGFGCYTLIKKITLVLYRRVRFHESSSSTNDVSR